MGFYSMEQLAKRNSGWRGRERGGSQWRNGGDEPEFEGKTSGKS